MFTPTKACSFAWIIYSTCPMPRPARCSVVVVLFLGLALSSAAMCLGSATKLAPVERLFQAVIASDKAAVDALLAPQFVYWSTSMATPDPAAPPVSQDRKSFMARTLSFAFSAADPVGEWEASESGSLSYMATTSAIVNAGPANPKTGSANCSVLIKTHLTAITDENGQIKGAT